MKPPWKNFPSDERGLMYSFFASLGTLQIDKTPSITPSTAPVSSTVHLRSDMLPNCQLVKVKTAINIDNAPLAQAYMTSDDINNIDQTAIEGFSVKEGYDWTHSNKRSFVWHNEQHTCRGRFQKQYCYKQNERSKQQQKQESRFH